MYQKILVPTDLCELTHEILDVARKLAAPDAELCLMHVLDDQYFVPFDQPVRYLDDRENELGQQLDELARSYGSDKLTVTSEVTRGSAYRKVLTKIDAWKPDIVVMGSHGRKGVMRFLLGSVAERVVRESPVLTVIVKTGVKKKFALDKIALATDLESPDAPSMHEFNRLLTATAAEGHLVHAYDRSNWMDHWARAYGSGEEVEPPQGAEQIIDATERHRRAQLAKEAEMLRGDGHKIQAELIDDEPWDGVTKYCEKHAIDLLITGTHRYHGFDRLVLGSVAERILRLAKCPVLVVPHLVKE